MTNQNKYYHNDYKKIIGLDQTRTASEKLLDRAVGGFKNKVQTKEEERMPEKKVKQQNLNLSQYDILEKLLKNIDLNVNATKIIKPLNILKKCLNNQQFTKNDQINKLQQWKSTTNKLLAIDEKIVGNYSENGLVIECLVQIFGQIILILKESKQELQLRSVKLEQDQIKKIQQKQPSNLEKLLELIQISEFHLIYLKLYTDDSFAFNKLLLEFKKKFYQFYQLKLHQKQPSKPQFYHYLQSLLMKLFKLPHQKYEWIKQSLSQFFKDFNIQYKHLLAEANVHTYLQAYNQFINQKSSSKAVDAANIIGNGGKGGKITMVQSASDGLDKWTSKQ